MPGSLLEVTYDTTADATLGQDARKFKAPRSLRDVEPSVNLWLKRLDGMAIEMPADGEDT